ncbi:hypothetical protein KI387_019874, partial [Taxus chinensis]
NREAANLERILRKAAMPDNTIIISNYHFESCMGDSISMIDLFLESFRGGDGISSFLKHLVIVALDQKAYDRCQYIHAHCFMLKTEGVDFSGEKFFMTDDYLKMMWRRIDFMRMILELGFNFVFTDADIMWFRDPFPHFSQNADFQIACDHFIGNSADLDNRPNGGFTYVNSNNRKIEIYKYRYRLREVYPGKHDQDVLNIIKYGEVITEMGLKMRFLDTAYFGGLCEPSKDLNKVCTMHVNCCYGLSNKLHDVRLMLEDWKHFQSMTEKDKRLQPVTWRVPLLCRRVYNGESPGASDTVRISTDEMHRSTKYGPISTLHVAGNGWMFFPKSSVSLVNINMPVEEINMEKFEAFRKAPRADGPAVALAISDPWRYEQ